MYCLTMQIILYTVLVGAPSRGSVTSQENTITKIACGTLNVGQVKDVKITIANHGAQTMVADRIFVCCGNSAPLLSAKTVEPGGHATLLQKVKRKRPGPFTITCGVHLNKPAEKRLSFSIEGEAKQPIRAAVGWDGTPLLAIEYSKEENRLDPVHYGGERALRIQLSAKRRDYALRDSLSFVSSKYFELDPQSVTYDERPRLDSSPGPQKKEVSRTDVSLPSSRLSQKSSSPVMASRADTPEAESIMGLVLRVRPNSAFPVGELRDEIVVSLKDGSECYLPLTFRSVGDVYGEVAVLGVGEIPRTAAIKRPFKIYFSDKVKPWPKLAWKVEGKLSDAVKVSLGDRSSEESCLNLTIEVDGRALPATVKGYLSSRIQIMAEGSEKETVPVVVYGVIL